jgi:hypothetical protein
MADIPLAVLLEGDYGYKVLVLDTNDTMATIVEKTSEQLVGVLVAPFPEEAVLKVRIQGNDEPIADDTTIADAGFVEMEAIEVYRAA